MNPRTLTALVAGKALTKILKTSGRGATAAPGLYALKIDPYLLKNLSSNLEKIILITGTNGKTTTARLLSTILKNQGLRVVHNRAGSNLVRGLASTLIEHQSFFRRSKPWGIFEVDEAALPKVLEQITPDLLLVNNLFRDQLDRYGEVTKIHTLWKEALTDLPESTTVLLNSDDPNVADLGTHLTAKTIYFGLDDPKAILSDVPHTIDARVCQTCSSPLEYDYFHLSHLGKYKCSNCDFTRPTPDYVASDIDIKSVEEMSFDLHVRGGKLKIKLPISGMYNIYNSLAATTLAHELGVEPETIQKGLESFEAAFGRQQKIKVGKKTLSINLVKNPVGYNEVLRLFSHHPGKLHLFLLLNDSLADGTDVSWIWDVDFEKLKDKIDSLTLAGTRHLELANRLKYAAVAPHAQAVLEPDLKKALARALLQVPGTETLYILPTYTAMLALQDLLKDQGLSKAFWEN